MLPSCRIDDRMAQMFASWSACKPIVSKHWTKSWKSWLSCFTFISHALPWTKHVKPENEKNNKYHKSAGFTWALSKPGWGRSRSQLLAGKDPACPTRSTQPTVHKTHGSFSLPSPTRTKMHSLTFLMQHISSVVYYRMNLIHMSDTKAQI